MAGPDPGRAWSWVASLRDGGTTPWSRWPVDAAAAPASGRDLPGVQQLELARRVNLAAANAEPSRGPDPAARAVLVDRVLAASAAGRGAPERELVGAVPERGWGLPPVDPGTLSDDDLLRVATTLLAQDVAARGSTPAGAPAGTTAPARAARRLRRDLQRLVPRRRPHRHGHRVVGAPWAAWAARDELLRRGRPLGADPRSRTVVVGDDVASMLVDAYTARVFGGQVTSWERWLGRDPARRLPRAADLAALARRWAPDSGPGGLVVVAEPTLLPGALGLPDRAATRLAPPRPSADGVELTRRLALPLALLVEPGERRGLLRRVLLPRLLDDAATHPAGPLGVPADHLPWVVQEAERVRDDLRSAGYPVLGDLGRPGRPVPSAAPPAGARVPDDAGVLALAVRLLLAAPPRQRHPQQARHPRRSEDT